MVEALHRAPLLGDALLFRSQQNAREHRVGKWCNKGQIVISNNYHTLVRLELIRGVCLDPIEAVGRRVVRVRVQVQTVEGRAGMVLSRLNERYVVAVAVLFALAGYGKAHPLAGSVVERHLSLNKAGHIYDAKY